MSIQKFYSDKPIDYCVCVIKKVLAPSHGLWKFQPCTALSAFISL